MPSDTSDLILEEKSEEDKQKFRKAMEDLNVGILLVIRDDTFSRNAIQHVVAECNGPDYKSWLKAVHAKDPESVKELVSGLTGSSMISWSDLGTRVIAINRDDSVVDVLGRRLAQKKQYVNLAATAATGYDV